MNPSTTPTEQATQPLRSLHNPAVIHSRSDEIDGAYAAVDVTRGAGDIPPMHVHRNDDDGFYILEGTLRSHIGTGHAVHVRAGEFALAPQSFAH